MQYSQDAEDFGRSVAETLAKAWGDATAAPSGDLDDLWSAAQQQGWLDLGGARALDFLAVTVRELGRRACPFPVADAYVAAQLVAPGDRERIESGEMRVLVAIADPGAPLDGAVGATHLLVLESGTAVLHRVREVVAVPGLAVPARSCVTVHDVPEALGAGPEDVADAVTTYRLALAVRALAAAERAHRLAIEHAKVRRQFGKVVGGFGAVQQRVAACEVEVSAGTGLVDDAVAQLLAGRENAGLAAHLAAQFVLDVVTSVTFGAQHTLGAIGFFEEHEVSWLFRRVHADVLSLGEILGDLTSNLVEQGSSLPAFDLGPLAESFRAEVRALLVRHLATDGNGYDVEALRAEMAERGLFSIGWSVADGGLEASVEEQVVLNEELKYAGGPVDRAMSAAALLGHSILRHGTEAQKAEFLPMIRAGQMAFCLGYSEPGAGSDLASLRTRAELDETTGEWVVNGQKLWTTRAHTASHVWLAVRTDPDAKPRHAGITIFLVPMDTPGIQVQQHVALSGEISCTVFYDDMRIPDTMRVGEVDGGWKVITDALSAERVVMGGVAATLLRHFDELLLLLRRDPNRLGPPGSHRRHRLASLAARLQSARALVLGATRSMDGGVGNRLASPMAAVLSGELAEDFGQAALELLGPAAALGADAPGALGNGVFEQALRVAPMYVIGGGTNDIQRGIIARGLGLPRE